MRNGLFLLFGIVTSLLIIAALAYNQNRLVDLNELAPDSERAASSPTSPSAPSLETTESLSLTPGTGSPDSPNPEGPMSIIAPDLTPDENGLSKATVVMNTSEGVIKFKFYPLDAPKTTQRIAQLIQSGFYNGLTFHRVVPGFVIQGGDPAGNGTGGSGQKLEAEFNNRRHIEGAVAMARAADPNSADSQFYISLGTHPHLDRNYTVFGQVIEGMDVVKKITAGDKMTSVIIE